MAERICEYIFLLRKSQQFIVNEMFQKYLGKKTLQQFLQPPDRLDDSFVHVSDNKMAGSSNSVLMN